MTKAGIAIPPTFERPDEDVPDWRRDAACLDEDPESFFPPEGRNTKAKAAQEVRAKKVCGGCPVRHPCLAGAIFRQEEHGVWGGLTSDERDALIPRGRISPDDALALADRLLLSVAAAGQPDTP